MFIFHCQTTLNTNKWSLSSVQVQALTYEPESIGWSQLLDQLIGT